MSPRLARLLFACLLALSFLGRALAASSDTLPGAQLPAGETVVAMAWNSGKSVTLVTQASEGYAVRDLDIGSGEFSVVGLPPGFKRLRPANKARFVLADDGSGLAVLQAAARPLQPATLTVYRRSGASFEPASQRGIPQDFWVGGLAWGGPGQLFLSARPYLFPDQLYSIGRLDTTTGEFRGEVLKENIDLPGEFVVLPQRNVIVAECSGYRGEYPDEPVIAAWDMTAGASTLLHAEARGLRLMALDGHEVFITSSNALAAQHWELTKDSAKLQPVEAGLAAKSSAAAVTADSRWLIVLIHGADLTRELEPEKNYVAMQSVSSGRTLAIAAPCSGFALAPDSSAVAAVADGGRKVYYYSLPVEPASAAAEATSTVPASPGRNPAGRDNPY